MTVLQREGEKTDEAADAWRDRTDDLARWAWINLVNRRDIYGGQRLDPLGEYKRTVWRGLTWGLLYRHFAALGTLDVIGLHCTAPDETCRWIGVDIDAHEGQGASPESNLNFAHHVHFLAINAGLDARLVDSSGGRGGYHLWVVFGRSAPMSVARRLSQWLARDWAAFDLARCPDLFPGNHRLTGKRCGTWLRLPGRHHKRPSWARVWSPSRRGWLVGHEAIDALLSLTGRAVDPASIIPPDFDPISPKPIGRSRHPKAPMSSRTRTGPLQAKSPAASRQGGPARPARDLRLAISALEFYPNQDLEYDKWLAIGMALRSLADEEGAFRLWDDWSATSGKHEPVATHAAWRSLRPANEPGDIGLGTLFRLAMDAGWAGPSFLENVDRMGLRRRTLRSRRSGSISIPVRMANPAVGEITPADDSVGPHEKTGSVD